MKLYNTKQAATILKMPEYTLRRRIRDGKLKATLVNREYVLTEEDLKTFCQK